MGSWSLAALQIGAEGVDHKNEVPLKHGHALGVDSQQVHVLKELDHVSFGGLLKRQQGSSSEASVSLPGLGDLADKPLEWKTAKEQVRRLLVPLDVTQGDGPRAEVGAPLDSRSSFAPLL